MSFKDLSLHPDIVKSLEKRGITQPTEIQAKAIPILLGTKQVDFFGQAQTGTGKTLAFGIPLIQRIDFSNKKVQALIVVPTRELCVQVTDSLRAVSSAVRIESIYGGASMHKQIQGLRSGAHIVVGTPGRLNDHLRSKTLSLQTIRTLVLDEADIMLEMGFKKQIDEIMRYCSVDREIWLFSATVKPGISQIMKEYMDDPVTVRIHKQETGTVNIQQFYAVVSPRDRFNALCRFIDSAPEFYGLIFAQTKMLADELSTQLMRIGYPANALHGDMNQSSRNRVIAQFRKKEFTILVATDVAGRGIDISDLTHVINYSLPHDRESYVHRIGRTGRAGKEGIAISFINKNEAYRIKRLEHIFHVRISPIEIPTNKAIAHVHLKKVEDYINRASSRISDSREHMQQVHALLNGYEQKIITAALATLIDEKFFQHSAKQRSFER